MRHFSDEDDTGVDFMYQAGLAATEQQSPVGISASNISHTHPGVWKLFKAFAPKHWSDKDVGVAFGDVVLRYSESHRGYHNLSHLEDLASQFEFNSHLLTKPQAQAVQAALVLHDVIYECMPGEDEKASSDYAERFLQQFMAPKRLIRDSQKIILATASHKAGKNDFATRLFLDMDMSILASRPDIYARYVTGVRGEFCIKRGLTPEQFDEARAEVFLKPVLESGRPIFTTEQYCELEPLAHSNMRRELAGAFAAKPTATLRR